MNMAERITEHPIMAYLTFIMPIILLLLGIFSGANVFILIVILAWLGAAFVILFLPLASNDSS